MVEVSGFFRSWMTASFIVFLSPSSRSVSRRWRHLNRTKAAKTAASTIRQTE